MIEIIFSVLNGSKRIDKFNDELFLKKCYGNKLIADKLLIDAEDFSRILFFIDGDSWSLEDHEKAITLWFLLPNPLYRKHYIENNYILGNKFFEAHVYVHNFLQDQNKIN